ncbi:MAG: hypothetical protein DWP97_09740 [Calditrichaeota bacterium]|nr:MAG: hypothetical protein DWP97_09740 [Calditrichota bacterium]
MRLFIYLLLLGFIVCTMVKAETKVTYVSSEGLYINAGTNAGLQKGDTLTITRKNQIVATIIIENISTKSAACKILTQSDTPLTDDIVLNINGSPLSVTEETKKINQDVSKQKKQKTNPVNRVGGYISFQQYYQKDFTNSSLSSYQPSLKTKLKIDNISNSNLTFKLSMRSRYYQRSRQITVSGDKNEWSHRLYEFAVYAEHTHLQWSFGRQSVYQAQGVGFIDGFYLAKKMNEYVSIGGAVGSEPNHLDQNIDFNRKKAAVFVSYERGNYKSGRYNLSAAFAGSYLSDGVNREFFNLSADYYSESFSTYHSVEIDLFRSWRKEAIGSTFKFSNYYGRINYKLSNTVKINFSYDNRHQIRYFDDVYITDSLFDANNHQGIRFGTIIKIGRNTTFSGNTGIRFRSDDIDDNKFINTSLNLARFPTRKNFLSFRFAYVKTMFTNAYRPSLSFRFPIFTKMYLTTSASSNIYKTGTTTTTNTYVDLNSYYSFTGKYFMSGSIRQYLDSELKSTQLYIEIGRNL